MNEHILESNVPQALPPFEQLIDRRVQLDKFTDTFDRISRQGPMSSNLFEWYGSPGIGKSMLVTMLASKTPGIMAATGQAIDKPEQARQFSDVTHQVSHEEPIPSKPNSSWIEKPLLSEKKRGTVAAKRNIKNKPKSRIPRLELIICYIATLVLAGVIADKGLESPAVWGFLGVAIGLLFGRVPL